MNRNPPNPEQVTSESTTDQLNMKALAPPFSGRLVFAGLTVFAAFVGLLAAWSIYAPISSAVIAPGVVSVDSYRKKIQHLEGGIIDEIKVKDGDQVRRGDVLIKLRDVAASAAFERLRAQYFEALAIAARSSAERDNLDQISFGTELTTSSDPASGSAIRGQTRVFESRRKLFQHSLSVIRQKIVQSREEIVGLQGQLASVLDQSAFFNDEVKDAKGLFERNLMAKTRYLELLRERAKLEGQKSELKSAIAQTKQKVLELELKITEMQGARISQSDQELREQQTLAYELSRKLIAARDVLLRTQIRSPIDGVIVNLRVHTRDGVIRAGQDVLEVVPSNDRLVVESRVKPEDIEEVRVGLKAHVLLTSLNRRDRRPIEGVLKSISADRLTDKVSGRPFYQVRVQMDPASIKAQGVTLLAGMGANVFIQTGERTPLQYIAAPIVRTFHRGLREN